MTFTKITKRDGRTVQFDKEKISNAIAKALRAKGEVPETEVDDVARSCANTVCEKLNTEGNATPSVEHIQDVVEKVLMESGFADTAKAYILYRAERSRVREANTRLMKTYHEITFADAKDSDVKRENANIDGNTAMGAMLKYGSEGAKEFYNKFMLKPEHAKAHTDGDIHIHDLDFYSLTTTCTQIEIKKLFKGGFSTGHGHLREPNDIASYAALACIAIQSNQNDQHGGQSIVDFDYGLADGVKKTFKRLYAKNLAKVLAIRLEDNLKCVSDVEIEATVKMIMAVVEERTGLYPRVENVEEYQKEEIPKLAIFFGLGEEEAKKVQKKAYHYALSETDRATYQAMEALIHNLNTSATCSYTNLAA